MPSPEESFLKAILLRLLLAVVLSSASLAGTLYYYHSTAPQSLGRAEAVPLAFVTSVDGLHHARREGSLFWTPMQEADLLYAGDSLKTSDQGHLKIQFILSAEVLELESDTFLQLRQEGDLPIVEIQEGYVQADSKQENGESAAGVRIKTESGLEPLPTGESLLSREKSGPLRVSRNSSVILQNPYGITWSAPAGDFEVELNPEDPKPATFSWLGAEKDDVRLGIQWGASRKQLDNKLLSPTSQSGPSTLEQLLPIGRHFWRWAIFKEGENDPIWSSPSAKVVVKGLFPPPVTSPAGGAVVRVKDLGEEIVLRWIPSERFSDFKIEVAADAEFSEPFYQGKPTERQLHSFRAPKPGSYFWRLSGLDTKKDQWLRTKTHSFKVALKLPEKINLKWITKSDEVHHYISKKPTLKLAWSSDSPKLAKEIVRQYKVRVAPAGESVADAPAELTPQTELTLSLLQRGRHLAQIEAVNAESEIIGKSPVLEIDAQPVPHLRAPAMAYATDKPIQANGRGDVALTWSPVDGAKEYFLELRDPSGKVIPYTAKKPEHQFQKLLPGLYDVKVYGVDSHGRQGEVSDSLKILVPNKSALKPIRIKKVEVR
jgi:hypothetical protein